MFVELLVGVTVAVFVEVGVSVRVAVLVGYSLGYRYRRGVGWGESVRSCAFCVKSRYTLELECL